MELEQKFVQQNDFVCCYIIPSHVDSSCLLYIGYTIYTPTISLHKVFILYFSFCIDCSTVAET